jgi:hypothetical protein
MMEITVAGTYATHKCGAKSLYQLLISPLNMGTFILKYK